MPQSFSLTDNPPSINFIEVNLDRADGTSTSPGADGDNWATLKQSDDVFIGNRKYLIIVNARVGGPHANFLNSFRVTQDHDGSNITPTMTKEPGTATSPHTYAAAEIFTPPVDTKINFQARSHSAVIWANFYYLRIVALDITDLREGLDYFHSTDSTAADHVTSWTARNEYIIDDSSTGVPSEQIAVEGDGFAQAVGDWLILSTALIDVDSDGTSSDSYGMEVRAGHGFYYRGSPSYNTPVRQQTQEEGEDIDERAVVFSAFTQDVSRGVVDTKFGFKVKLSTADPVDGGGPPNEYISSTLIGLNLSRFKDVEINYDGQIAIETIADDEITIDTWSANPSNNGKGFIIACGICDIEDAAQPFWCGMDQDDVDVFDLGTGISPDNQAAAGYSNAATDRIPFVAMGLVDLDASSTHVYKWQWNPLSISSTKYKTFSYAMCSLTYDHEDFYDDKLEPVKMGEVRRRKSSPTIPTM